MKKFSAVLALRNAIQQRIIDKIIGQIEMKSWILQSESKLTAVWVFLWLSLCLSHSVLRIRCCLEERVLCGVQA